MSGPLEDLNEGPQPRLGEIEIKQGRTADVGGIGVLRVLPTKKRRTVGPWCFVDLMHPGDLSEPPPIEIGPAACLTAVMMSSVLWGTTTRLTTTGFNWVTSLTMTGELLAWIGGRTTRQTLYARRSATRTLRARMMFRRVMAGLSLGHLPNRRAAEASTSVLL